MLKGPIGFPNNRILAFCAEQAKNERQSFEIEKFCSKFERPSKTGDERRRNDAWSRWISKDESIPTWDILGPNWAAARILVHRWLASYKIGNLTFTNGSSFEPLGSRVSLACKLTDSWTITHDCFDLFARLAYKHKAFRHAVKKRFRGYCMKHGWDERKINRIIWHRFNDSYRCFEFKTYCLVSFVQGDRFSTVPKNNEKDRAISLQPSCNMFVQRAIGLGFRRALKEACGIDLDNLAERHRSLIADSTLATMDLSDCSDSISLKLIRYLIPRRIFSQISASRSAMTLGPDDQFYLINKVSSMGNGFTFDLMTIVLLALTRSFDDRSSVFGDDIICRGEYAHAIIEQLQKADFTVNLKKTNINTGFRESCGSHYRDGYGYVVCFDQRWIHNEHDLIVFLNKLTILSSVYGEPWLTLLKQIESHVPPIFYGVATDVPVVDVSKPLSFDLSNYVKYGARKNVQPLPHQLKAIRRLAKDYQYHGKISVAKYLSSEVRPGKRNLESSDWDMFYQNLSASRSLARYAASKEKASLVAIVGEDLIGPLNAMPPRNGK